MNGIRVVRTKAEFNSFIEFPYSHYAGDTHWVPPLRLMMKDLLDREKHPFFKNAEADYFLAERDGVTVGRVAAIKSDSYIAHTGNKSAFFGFFEAVDDPSVVALMMRVVEDWAKVRGLDSVIGPMSPNMMGEMGFLVDGFESDPTILMPYTKPYYDKLITEAGYAKEVDLVAYLLTRENLDFEHVERGNALVRRRYPTLSVRAVSKKNFKKEALVIGDIFNQAWSKNWGFAPLSKEEFAHLANDLKLLIDFDYAHIAEDNGKPVAFAISLPDYNVLLKKMDGKLFPTGIFQLMFGRKKINTMRTALMGVLPEYHGKGVDSFVILEGLKNGLAQGYQSSELSWLLETNTAMINVAERLGAKLDKRYRTYKKMV